jgi:hypothetical protein
MTVLRVRLLLVVVVTFKAVPKMTLLGTCEYYCYTLLFALAAALMSFQLHERLTEVI